VSGFSNSDLQFFQESRDHSEDVCVAFVRVVKARSIKKGDSLAVYAEYLGNMDFVGA
jgi:hypothetical protein